MLHIRKHLLEAGKGRQPIRGRGPASTHWGALGVRVLHPPQSLVGGCWGGHLVLWHFWPAMGSGQQDKPLEKEMQMLTLEIRCSSQWEGQRDHLLQLLRHLASSLSPLGSCSGYHVLCRVRPAWSPFVTLPPFEGRGNVWTLGPREESECPNSQWLWG